MLGGFEFCINFAVKAGWIVVPVVGCGFGGFVGV